MDILSQIVSALKTRERVVLATIISSSGSTPLPTGSSMLTTQRGAKVLGTIGGGLLEAKVAKESAEFFVDAKESVIREFALNDSGSGEGMICGGSVDVLIERLEEEALDVFSQLVAQGGGGNDCLLLRRIDPSGAVTRIALGEMDENVVSVPLLAGMLKDQEVEPATFLQQLQRSHREERVVRLAGRGGELIIQPIAGVQPLLIFGGGHVGRAVAMVSAATGFTVTIIDDRQEYVNPDRFPGAVVSIAKKWTDAFSEITITPSTSVVIVTRGHQSDREVLGLALGTPARYIGMIGSARKVATTYDGLRKAGIPAEAFRRVHAPIGLDIGAITAEEIAISIVAELIRERRRFRGASSPLSEKMNQWHNPRQ